MSDIKKSDIEWATIDRLRLMLSERHEEYDVTHSFALFTSIICWICQGVRTKGTSIEDRKAKTVRSTWQQKSSDLHPFALVTTTAPLNSFESGKLVLSSSHSALSSEAILIAIRNAVAHGDARTVKPWNKGDELCGYILHLKEPEDGSDWQGELRLSGADMRRIGVAIATEYCQAMMPQSRQPHVRRSVLEPMQIAAP